MMQWQSLDNELRIRARNAEKEKMKKLYGEKFVNTCPEYLYDQIKKYFAVNNKLMECLSLNLGSLTNEERAVYFRDLFYFFNRLRYIEQGEKNNVQWCNPVEFSDVQEFCEQNHYRLFECKNEQDVLVFKKYYNENESPCTYDDIEGRLNTNDIYFLVRDDTTEIGAFNSKEGKFQTREEILDPQREDFYSTSVLMIQFDKREKNIERIVSRYNHGVLNPDEVYDNNLDEIINGLKEKFGGLGYKYAPSDVRLSLEGFVVGDGVNGTDIEPRFHYCLSRYVNFDHSEPMEEKSFTDDFLKQIEASKSYCGVHFCANNVVILSNGEPRKYDPEKFVVLDGFIVDKQQKKVLCLDENGDFVENDFTMSFGNIQKISDVVVKEKRIDASGEEKEYKTSNNKLIFDVQDGKPIEIVYNKNYGMIEYKNDNVVEIGDNFIPYARALKKISMKSVKSMGDNCFEYVPHLKQAHFPLLENVGDFCFYSSNMKSLVESDFSSLESFGNFSFNHVSINEIKDKYVKANNSENVEEME